MTKVTSIIILLVLLIPGGANYIFSQDLETETPQDKENAINQITPESEDKGDVGNTGYGYEIKTEFENKTERDEYITELGSVVNLIYENLTNNEQLTPELTDELQEDYNTIKEHGVTLLGIFEPEAKPYFMTETEYFDFIAAERTQNSNIVGIMGN